MAPLVLLGGTFDPPHFGHLLLGECARVQFGAAEVRFLPAGDPYRKAGTRPGGADPTPAYHRLAMTRLAVAGNSAFRVDDRETRRQGPTYTVDTLEELRAELGAGGPELILVLGSDAVADMPNWKTPGRILELARVVVAEKDGAARDERFARVEMPRLPISSTLIRERVARRQPVRYLVPDAVAAYIAAEALYRPGPAYTGRA